jgi:hypothetical protein
LLRRTTCRQGSDQQSADGCSEPHDHELNMRLGEVAASKIALAKSTERVGNTQFAA